ncbi:MAG: BrnT family toxin [Deltaproteobacteria bacterium]|nr:BrnT family toxin [Deltaproteobacteria bacterium]
MHFEWDPGKEKINSAQHRVSFTEACQVFGDPNQLNLFDSDHSEDEDRWVVIGEVPTMKIMVVIHTMRQVADLQKVRIISARKATKKERETYYVRKTK